MKAVLIVPGKAPGTWPVLGRLSRVPTGIHCLAQGAQPSPGVPLLSRQPRPLGEHAQESHWREAGRWHLVASPDNSTRRKMAA